jgi:hypothetical protein
MHFDGLEFPSLKKLPGRAAENVDILLNFHTGANIRQAEHKPEAFDNVVRVSVRPELKDKTSVAAAYDWGRLQSGNRRTHIPHQDLLKERAIVSFERNLVMMDDDDGFHIKKIGFCGGKSNRR